jgi:hypothetical protein
MRIPIPIFSVFLLAFAACSDAPTQPNGVTQGALAGEWRGTISGAGTQSTVAATVTHLGDNVAISFRTSFFKGGCGFTGTLRDDRLEGSFSVPFVICVPRGPASGPGTATRIRLEIPAIPRSRVLPDIECPSVSASTIELSR